MHERRLLEFDLTVGTPVTGETLGELQRCAGIDAAERRMVGLIARRARSEAEIRDRLETLGIDEAATADMLERFRSIGLLDDQALAEDVADRTRRRGHGELRTRSDLRRLRVEPDVAATVLTATPQEQREQAEAVILKRFGEIPAEPAGLSRASAFLARRGYDADTVAAVLRLDLD